MVFKLIRIQCDMWLWCDLLHTLDKTKFFLLMVRWVLFEFKGFQLKLLCWWEYAVYITGSAVWCSRLLTRALAHWLFFKGMQWSFCSELIMRICCIMYIICFIMYITGAVACGSSLKRENCSPRGARRELQGKRLKNILREIHGGEGELQEKNGKHFEEISRPMSHWFPGEREHSETLLFLLEPYFNSKRTWLLETSYQKVASRTERSLPIFVLILMISIKCHDCDYYNDFNKV